jgi:hypothetical protein
MSSDAAGIPVLYTEGPSRNGHQTTMKLEFESDIQWDGTTLSRWAVIDGQRIQLNASREMIHRLPLYNDAVSWEIERHKNDIFDRLKSELLGAVFFS